MGCGTDNGGRNGVQPGLDYVVIRVINEREETTNGVIQAVTIALPNDVQLTGTYVSPKLSATKRTSFLSKIVTRGSRRDWIVGDFMHGAHHGTRMIMRKEKH